MGAGDYRARAFLGTVLSRSPNVDIYLDIWFTNYIGSSCYGYDKIFNEVSIGIGILLNYVGREGHIRE